jgi:hypothetical protein
MIMNKCLALLAAALALNPAVNQSNIHATICVAGWTKTQRPSAQALRPIKEKLMAAIGASNPQLYELDHIVPLELGGAPLDVRNFQLQTYAGECNARDKDALEHELSRLVCARRADTGSRTSRDRERLDCELQRPHQCGRLRARLMRPDPKEPSPPTIGVLDHDRRHRRGGTKPQT